MSLRHRWCQPASHSLVIRTPAPCPYAPSSDSLRSSTDESKLRFGSGTRPGWSFPHCWCSTPFVSLTVLASHRPLSTNDNKLRSSTERKTVPRRVAVKEGRGQEVRTRETARGTQKTITDQTHGTWLQWFCFCSFEQSRVEIAIPLRFANPGIPKFLLPWSRDPGRVRNASKRDCLEEGFAIPSLIWTKTNRELHQIHILRNLFRKCLHFVLYPSTYVKCNMYATSGYVCNY